MGVSVRIREEDDRQGFEPRVRIRMRMRMRMRMRERV